MSYPKALVWGRDGREQQVADLMKKIGQALDEVVPLPPTTRFNVLDRIEAAVDEWQPFAMTWHPIYDDD